jgi:hypothetical protein
MAARRDVLLIAERLQLRIRRISSIAETLKHDLKGSAHATMAADLARGCRAAAQDAGHVRRQLEGAGTQEA